MDIAKLIFYIISTVVLVVTTIYLGIKANKFSKQSNDIMQLSYVQQKEMQDTQIKLMLYKRRYEIYSFLTDKIFQPDFYIELNNFFNCYQMKEEAEFLFDEPEQSLIIKKLDEVIKVFVNKQFPEIEFQSPDIFHLLSQEKDEKKLNKLKFNTLIAFGCNELFMPYLKLTKQK